MEDFISNSNPKLHASLEKLNFSTTEFYQLESLHVLEDRDLVEAFVKDSTGDQNGEHGQLMLQPVDYDADSEADTSHTMTPRPSLHKRRSTFKKEKSRVRCVYNS